MADLVLYLGITAIGYFLVSRIRDKKEKLGWTGAVQNVAITALVLLMGARMGANREVTDNLRTIGITAFFMTVAIMVCSIGAIFIVRKLLGIDRYGRLVCSRPQEKDSDENISMAVHESPHQIEEDEKKQGVNTMTVIILVSVIIGMLAGYFVVRRVFDSNMDTFDYIAALGIKIGLCLLLVFVGIDLGIEGTVVKNFKAVGLRILAIPAAVAIGTLLASFVMSFFTELTTREAMAVGAGFGWYSLAPGIIMEAGHMTASAVCFLHNVMRELFAILFIPAVAKNIGYVETVGMPGSAAMDVCLPIVEKATRSDIAVYSFISGAVLSTLVPILVPVIIG